MEYNILMISGVGIDLVDLKQFKRYLNQSSHFKSRLFSPAEHLLTDDQLAGNYAAKEALFKASSIKFEFSKCSVLRDKNGKPFITFDYDIITHKKLSISVSITNNQQYSVAIVIIETKL
jgi:phosphopantetheine--protein transferase-like protein